MVHPSSEVSEILSLYSQESTSTLDRLKDLFGHGAVGGTGKLIISAVDQGFEHGPTISFSMNAQAFDPDYHYELAIEGGLSALAAPLGFLETGFSAFKGKIPTILKLNSAAKLTPSDAPQQAVTASVEDAIRLGCHGIGFTLYPGSAHFCSMIEQFQKIALDARRKGLIVMVWSYPRGHMSKAGERAIDVVSYGAHIACLLGAHIIKVKIPTNHVEYADSEHALRQNQIPTASMDDCIQYVVRSCFNGRRIVLFSGGDTKSETLLIDEARSIHRSGGFGSIIGRNFFQRSRQESLGLIEKLINVYQSKG